MIFGKEEVRREARQSESDDVLCKHLVPEPILGHHLEKS